MSAAYGERLRAAAPYIAACAVALAFFTVVELVHPYYFLQDDNRDIFLPFYLHNYRAALDGQLAQYNFFQSLGKPHYATGQTATLHPVPYVAIFASELLFGHFWAAVDILVLIYLLMGAAGIVYLVRLAGFSGLAAVFAATSWCLSPYNAMKSQSWTTYAPMIGLLPWCLAGALLVLRRRTTGACVLFAIAHLAVFYVGAPQFFLYTVLLELLFVGIIIAGDLRRGILMRADVLRVVRTFAIVAAVVTLLCMPLLVPMWAQMQQSAFRGAEMPAGALSVCRMSLTQLLNGFFVPFRDLYEPLGNAWCETYFPASFTHQGYLATLLLIVYPFVRRKHLAPSQRALADAAFLTGIVFLLAALGALVPLVEALPIVNRFRWPFKHFGFANVLLAGFCTAVVTDVLLRRFEPPRRRLLAGSLLIAIQFVNLLVLDATFRRQAFFEHLDPIPAAEPLAEQLRPGRSISVGCRRVVEQQQYDYTIASLGFDYGTLWELHYFGGYDPLVPARNLYATLGLEYAALLCMPPEHVPVGYLRAWGVRTYILNEPLARRYEPVLARHGLRRVHSDADRVVMFDPSAEPLVGGRDCTSRGLGRIGDDFATSVACSRAGELTLRFLYNPHLHASVNGRPVAIRETSSGQIAMDVPAGVHEVRLSFDDPLIDVGMSIALATLCVLALTAVFRSR